jgi:hypothetical protein
VLKKLITLMDEPSKYGNCTGDDLEVGIMLQDIVSGDIAILARRYNVMREWREELPVWAWDMLWTGPATNSTNRDTPFTEFGILGLINSGRWLVIKGDPAGVNI